MTMKTKAIYLSAVLALFSLSTVFGQVKTDKFTVSGSCDMCETRIEKTANSVKGVKSADWVKETKMLEITYNSNKTNTEAVQLAVANVGHDTKMHKAKDEIYNALPACCKYEREPADTKAKCGDKKECS